MSDVGSIPGLATHYLCDLEQALSNFLGDPCGFLINCKALFIRIILHHTITHVDSSRKPGLQLVFLSFVSCWPSLSL
jgi:hypothetical protein